MLLLDGRKVRDEIVKKLRERIAKFSSPPALAIIQIGGLEESNAYIACKKVFAASIRAKVRHVALSESVSEPEIISSVQTLNAEASVHGIILQLPIPLSLNRQKLLDAVAREKDVDGLGAESSFIPATARGIVELLEFYRLTIFGKKIAILGRSALVGTPTAKLLRARGAEVTVCHSQTQNAKEITHASDIIVVAIGKPRFIGPEYVRDDGTQTIVDVGITAVRAGGVVRLHEEISKRKLVGDVDFERVKDKVAAISPVPGGVGPMTVAGLFENLVSAYERQHSG